MAETEVARVDDVTPEKMMLVLIDDTIQVALANLDGEIVAFSNICHHADCEIIGGPLGDPPLEGEEIECGCHFSRFNVRTGERLEGPSSLPLTVYPVRVEDGAVFVEID